LTVNARPFVDAIKASLAEQDLIPDAAVDVLFYEDTRDRKQIRIRTGDATVSAQAENFRTEHGYLVEFAQAGHQAQLLVQGPLYQEPKPEFSATCTYCGMQYIRRNYDSVLAHRAHHRQKRRCYDPIMSPQFVQRLAHAVDGDRVDATSPVWMHRETYERAVMFKREMGFDRPQWESPPQCGRPVTETGVAYLLGTPDAPGAIVGACAFREQRDGWKLDWVWVAPKWRHHGVLQRYWPRFLANYGDFHLEYPVSPDMQAFVHKHGTVRQREVMQRNLQRLASRS
jgi:hypothetical protein